MKLDSLFETNSYDSPQESPNITKAKSNQFNPMAMSSPIQNYSKFKNNNNYYEQGKYEQAKTKSSKVNIANLDPLLKSLSGKLLKGLVITSGNDSKHMKGSKHYSNKAIDIGANSSDKKAYQTFKEMLKNPTYKKNLMASHNIQDIIDEGDHLHIEQMKMGGKIKKCETGGGIGMNTNYYANKMYGTPSIGSQYTVPKIQFNNKNTGTTSKANTIGIASQLGQLGSAFIDSTNNPENPNITKSALSGALGGASTGAGLGTAILPGIGTAVGAVVGGIVGAVGGSKKAKEARELFAQKQATIQNNYNNNVKLSTQARYSAFPAKGNSGINYYKYGGKTKSVIDSLNFRASHNIRGNKTHLLEYFLPKTKPKYEDGTKQPMPQYEAEKGEIIIGNDVQGNAKEISTGVHLVKGKTHDQKNPKSVNGTGEDFTGGDFIFSNSISPDGRKSFAEYAKAIAIKNKPDVRMKNSTDYIHLNTVNANEQLKQARLEQLAQLQEAIKEETGIPTPQMRFGGLIRYAGGGETRESKLKKLQNQQKELFDEMQAEQVRIANTGGSGDSLNEIVRVKNKIDNELMHIESDINKEKQQKIKEKNELVKKENQKVVNNYLGDNKNKAFKSNFPNVIGGIKNYFSPKVTDKSYTPNYTETSRQSVSGRTLSTTPVAKKDNRTVFLPYKDGTDTFQRKGFAGSRWMYDKNTKKFIDINTPATGTSKPTIDKPPVVDNKDKRKGTKFDVNKAFGKLDKLRSDIESYDKVKPNSTSLIKNKQPNIIPTNMAKMPNIGNMKDVVDNMINPKKEDKRTFGDWMNTNGNNLMGLTSIGANYLTNRNNINRMNTDVNVALNEAPDYQYRQRNALANHDILGNIRSVNNAPFLNNGARQDVYGKILNTLNQSNEAEAQRKFEYNTNYLNAVNANKNQNNQIISAARNQQIQNQNQKRGLLSDNTNQLFQNLNTFQKEQQDLVTNKENMALISSTLATKLGVNPYLINSGFLSGTVKYDKNGNQIT